MPWIDFQQFLAELHSFDDCAWVVSRQGPIRFNDDGILYDPLTAVCEKVTGRFYSVLERPAAGSKLGFLTPVTESIIQACDNTSQNPHVQTMRARILETLSLRKAN